MKTYVNKPMQEEKLYDVHKFQNERLLGISG